MRNAAHLQNQFPDLLARGCKNRGRGAQPALHVDVDVNSITPGGAFLYDHWRSGVALGRLRELQPNFLILQGQSIEPLLAPRKFNYYASLFKTDADRISAKTILFSTWARPAGDPYYKDVTSGGSNYHASLPATTAETLQRIADAIPLNPAK